MDQDQNAINETLRSQLQQIAGQDQGVESWRGFGHLAAAFWTTVVADGVDEEAATFLTSSVLSAVLYRMQGQES